MPLGWHTRFVHQKKTQKKQIKQEKTQFWVLNWVPKINCQGRPCDTYGSLIGHLWRVTYTNNNTTNNNNFNKMSIRSQREPASATIPHW
jgi:hypothetical protein